MPARDKKKLLEDYNLITSESDGVEYNLGPEYDWGDHPLHYLARFHCADELKTCLDRYQPINLDIRNNFEQTPLVAAAHALYLSEFPSSFVEGTFVKTFEVLFEYGCDPTAQDIKGWSAIHYLLFNYFAIFEGDELGQYSIGNVITDQAKDAKREVILLMAHNHASSLKAFLENDLMRDVLSQVSPDDAKFFRSFL